ncbi:hypothetical protein BDR26DRAFT_868698, partial [Obelidium mucronatum]
MSRSPSTKSNQSKSEAGGNIETGGAIQPSRSQKGGLSSFNRKFWQVFGGGSKNSDESGSVASSKRNSIEKLDGMESSGVRNGRTASAPLLDDLPSTVSVPASINHRIGGNLMHGNSEENQSVTLNGPETVFNSENSIVNGDEDANAKKLLRLQNQATFYKSDSLNHEKLSDLTSNSQSAAKAASPTTSEETTASITPPPLKSGNYFQQLGLLQQDQSNSKSTATSANENTNGNNLQINIISATPSSLDYAFLKRCDSEQKQFAEARSSLSKLQEDAREDGDVSLNSETNSPFSLPAPGTQSNGVNVITGTTGGYKGKSKRRTSAAPQLSVNNMHGGRKQSISCGAADIEGRLTLVEKVLGSLLFLRYLVPSIITPDIIPPTPAHRRGLILAGKVLTAASNGVEFGIKEDYMMPLNNLLKSYRLQIKTLVEALVQEGPESWKTPQSGRNAMTNATNTTRTSNISINTCSESSRVPHAISALDLNMEGDSHNQHQHVQSCHQNPTSCSSTIVPNVYHCVFNLTDPTIFQPRPQQTSTAMGAILMKSSFRNIRMMSPGSASSGSGAPAAAPTTTASGSASTNTIAMKPSNKRHSTSSPILLKGGDVGLRNGSGRKDEGLLVSATALRPLSPAAAAGGGGGMILRRSQSQRSTSGNPRRVSTPVPATANCSAGSVMMTTLSGVGAMNGNSSNAGGAGKQSNGFAKRASLPSGRIFGRKSATKLLEGSAKMVGSSSSGVSNGAISKLKEIFSGGGSATSGDGKIKTGGSETPGTSKAAMGNRAAQIQAINLFFATIASEMPAIAAEIAGASSFLLANA